MVICTKGGIVIQRIVLFKFEDPLTDAAQRVHTASRTRAVFEKLAHVVDVSVGTPADNECEKSWDMALTVRFDSMADFQAYAVDPDHRAYVDGVLKPNVVVMKAWNFEI